MNTIHNYQNLIDRGGDTDLTNHEFNTIKDFVMRNEEENPNAKYIEVGVFSGTTIKRLKDHTQTTQFTGVDLFEDYNNSSDNTHVSGTYTKADVEKFVGSERATFIKGDSHQILPAMQEKFNFAFIDGNHTFNATQLDFENAQKLLVPGGLIAFHNCSNHLEPDRAYVAADGGPWLVCENIIKSGQWNLIANADRLKVFSKI